MGNKFEKILGIEIDQKAYKAFIDSFGIKFGDVSIDINMSRLVPNTATNIEPHNKIEFTSIGLIGNPRRVSISSFGQKSE